MPFSQDDTDRIRSALRAALTGTALNDWQRTFLGDMQARFDKYGTKTRLSDKQYAKLKQLLAPYRASDPPRAAKQPSGPRPVPSQAKPRSVSRSPSRSRPPRALKAVRKARRATRDMAWALAAVFGVVIAIGAIFDGGAPAPSERLVSTTENGNPSVYGSGDFSITDGDTVQLRGARKGTRLVGFNTPETYEPRCDRELGVGRQATARLKALVQSANRVELSLVACACPPGTQGTNECNYGRSCGVLTVDGRDVGSILISEGLAVRFQCGRTSCPPLPRPWC